MYQFIDEAGTFQLENPDKISDLYFPLANEAGIMSSITPKLNGDCKRNQNEFILAPVSVSDLHNNRSSRNFWLRFEGKGIWSATGVSAKQECEPTSLEATRLTAGLLWHQMERESKEYGMKANIISFVPANDDQVELMAVTIKNCSKDSVKFSPIVAIPLYARSADNIRDHRDVTAMLHRTYVTECGVIVHPTLTFDERGHKENHIFYGVFAGSNGEWPIGCYPTVSEYIGEGGSFTWPEAVVTGRVPMKNKGTMVSGVEAMGALEFHVTTLLPEEEKTYYIAIGFGESKEQLECYTEYLNERRFSKAYREQMEAWQVKIPIRFHTGDKKFDSYLQWVSIQPQLRKIFGCSFLPHHDYGKGGRGWRDLWQDCLALLLIHPEQVRQLLVDNFQGVRIDGTNATIIGKKQGEFIADRNNITRVWMDHGAWPFLTIDLFLQMSGDYEVLLEEVPYFKDIQTVRGTAKDDTWSVIEGNCLKAEGKINQGEKEIYQGTVLEHLLIQNLTAFYDVGEHNVIRLHGADWNDALDMAPEHGESVAFTNLYAHNLLKLSEVILQLKQRLRLEQVEIASEVVMLIDQTPELYSDVQQKNQVLEEYCNQVRTTISGEKVRYSCVRLAEKLKEKAEWMFEWIRASEWITNEEGYSWFNGYYDNHSNRVEGSCPKGTRMMLTSQVFSIMAGTATKEMTKEIIAAVDHYLYEEALGGYRLNTDFHEVKLDLGRMFGFAYGQKENGAVFSHMAVMYANALYQRGFYEEGYKALMALYKHCMDFNSSRIYPGIPEYFDATGRGRYHYLTGAASWLLLTVYTEMFGIHGNCGDLCIEPHLCRELFDANGEVAVDMMFQNIPFHIVIQLKEPRENIVKHMIEAVLDGQKIALDKGRVRIRQEELALLEKTVHHMMLIRME